MDNDIPNTPITRQEFAAFARVVQNAINGVDAALREVFDHVNAVKAAASASAETASQLEALTTSLEDLRSQVERLASQSGEIMPATKAENYTPMVWLSSAVSGGVCLIFGIFFKALGG